MPPSGLIIRIVKAVRIRVIISENMMAATRVHVSVSFSVKKYASRMLLRLPAVNSVKPVRIYASFLRRSRRDMNHTRYTARMIEPETMIRCASLVKLSPAMSGWI